VNHSVRGVCDGPQRRVRAFVLTAFSVFIFSAGAAAQVVRVSVASDGTQADNASRAPAISADGRFIVFESDATNLVPGDTNGFTDIFLRDRSTNTTVRASVKSDGTQGDSHSFAPRISGDGRWVMFTSSARLVADDTNSCASPDLHGCDDVYLYDRQNQTTERVSVANGNVQGQGGARGLSISANGRFVFFSSNADNLVPADTNQTTDLFIRDVIAQTTTRVNVSSTGAQMDGTLYYRDATGTHALATMSPDGQVIAFASTATNLSEPFESKLCTGFFPCTPLYIRTLNNGQTTRHPLDPVDDVGPEGVAYISLAFSDDGTWLALATSDYGEPGGSVLGQSRVVIYNRLTQTFRRAGAVRFTGGGLAVSSDARFVAIGGNESEGKHTPGRVFDRLSQFVDPYGVSTVGPVDVSHESNISGSGRFLVFASQFPNGVVADTNQDPDIFFLDRDGDSDGLSNAWENQFGFDPTVGGEELADPDGDGLSNFEESVAGTHPKGMFKRYLAEGAQNAFFSTRFALANPTTTNAVAMLRLLGSNGQVTSFVKAVPARSRATVSVGGELAEKPDNDFSTVIESDQPIVIDRTMTWQNGLGSHAETSLPAPATNWFLAEGATHGAFDLFYLLQNPHATTVDVTITYLRPTPRPPVVKTYTLRPNSRRTIWVDTEDPNLAATDVSAAITAVQPIIVERAMYLTAQGQAFAAGHAGAGISAPAPRWFLAEGATGQFFDMYVLVANPSQTDTDITVTYLLPRGVTFSKTHPVAKQSRLTISVDVDDPRLLDTPVSVIVESVNGTGIIVERAMWWPGQGQWYEGHLSAGTTATGTRWALAEGEVNPATETYILIANTSASAGSATVTLLFEDGTSAQQSIPLAANSRENVPVSAMFPEAANRMFSALIESDGAQIVVERAMYTSTAAQTWAAGTAALGTRLQ